jgi:hypothetical protein
MTLSRNSEDLTPLGELREGRIQALLGYQLAQATIPTTDVFVRVVGKPFDLRPVEFTILQLIDENPAATATRIAKALAITTPRGDDLARSTGKARSHIARTQRH